MTRGDRDGTVREALLAVAAVTCLVAPVLMLAGVHSPLRALAGLLLFCLAPGAALLPFIAPRRAGVELALVVVVSLGVSAVAAQTMLWLGAWAPRAATSVLAAACLASIAAQLVHARRGQVT